MGGVIIEDGLLFPILEPPIAGDLAIVLIRLAITAFPVMELACAEPQPAEKPPSGQLRALLPVIDVIDDFVAGVVGNPASL